MIVGRVIEKVATVGNPIWVAVLENEVVEKMVVVVGYKFN